MSAPSEPELLDVEDVLALHATQLSLFGGAAGVRDRGLLESTVAQPGASFGGQLVHDGWFAMAAAYLFHIVRPHPLGDGNKRAGPPLGPGLPRHHPHRHRPSLRRALRADDKHRRGRHRQAHSYRGTEAHR